MLSFDWTNAFLLGLLMLFIIISLRTENDGLRIACHIVILLMLFGIVEPLFSAMYGAWMGYHIMGVQR